MTEQSHEISVASDQQNMLTMINQALHNKDITVEKLNGLLDFKERLDRKAYEVEANAAFSRVIANMPRIKKNGQIDFGKANSKPIAYAKWEDVQDAIRPIYEAEHFTLRFDSVAREGGGANVSAILTHANGHTFTASVPLPLDLSGGKQSIQGMGSTVSYGQRYSTKQLFNLVFEGDDDDGVRGGTTFINDAQAEQIKNLIIETRTDTLSFLRIFECASVENITSGNFKAAVNMLLAKKARSVKS